MVIANSVSYSSDTIRQEKASFREQHLKSLENNKNTDERQLEAMSTIKEAVEELNNTVEALQNPNVSASTVKNFVNTYNVFLDTFYTLTRQAPASPGSSPSPDYAALTGNTMLNRLHSDLNKSLHNLHGTQEVNSLNDLGISVQLKNNKIRLAVDDSKLKKVLSEHSHQVTSFLSGDGKTTGFATKFSKMLDIGIKNITVATDCPD